MNLKEMIFGIFLIILGSILVSLRNDVGRLVPDTKNKIFNFSNRSYMIYVWLKFTIGMILVGIIMIIIGF